jgi:hypothetical protein
VWPGACAQWPRPAKQRFRKAGWRGEITACRQGTSRRQRYGMGFAEASQG